MSDGAAPADRIGVLLVGTGTPDAPRVPEVRRYLAEFLSDPLVLDMNPLGRWLLLHLIILRRRPRRSAAAYRRIWTREGSPLLVHGRALRDGMQERLGRSFAVVLAMRYGNPSIADGLDALAQIGVARLVVLPLFPQYATATTGSVEVAVRKAAARRPALPPAVFVPAFYDDPGFLDALAAVGRPVIDEFSPDHVLLSFHGLPERQVRRADPSGAHCLVEDDCCGAIGEANRGCYRAQCFATARALANALELEEGRWTVSFQSRLGRAIWIGPPTETILDELAAAGVRRLAVLTPAFVADCLETLEEIGIRARERFRAAGGEELKLVPCLDAHPVWLAAAEALVRRA